MNMTPIKKMILGIAAVCVALTFITANSLTSVIMILSAKHVNSPNNVLVYEQQGQNNSNNSNSSNNSNNTSNNNSTNNSVTPNAPSSNNTNVPSNNNSNNNTNTDVKNPATDNTDKGDAGAAEQDGLKLYTEALNKAKSSATKVTRVRTKASNYKDHVKAGMLSSIAKTLMDKFMTENTEHVDVDKNDLPPKGLNCTLSSDAVQKVDVQKDGSNTIVTIVTKAESNPKAGSGIGSAISIIEEHTITDAVAGVIEISNIKLDYDPCTIKATIDGSGNLVALYVQAPCILSLTAMGIDAEVGIDCEDEFVIAY